ncbi:cupin domain-containing protein [Rhodobacteraceae bacterium]|nr:cupin domain-containing protein [Paracoccaceae bacterium]
MTADDVIALLNLDPHPEGGWYRQTWIGEGTDRATGTCIYFLLKAGETSHWHRVDATEIWHHYAGAPLVLRLSETEDGPATEQALGPDLASGARPQLIVPEHFWQSAEVRADDPKNMGWALVGCTVSPGFQFDGFELAPPGFDIPI